jgi:ribonuclease P protein component
MVDAPSVRGRLQRNQRVRQRTEYQSILARGVRVPTRHFVLIMARRLPAPEGVPSAAETISGPRLGLIVSRKVGNSVRRNRIRRVVREAFRATSGKWPPDVDLVVMARNWDEALGRDDVIREWEAAQGRVKAALVSHRLADPTPSRVAGASQPTHTGASEC